MAGTNHREVRLTAADRDKLVTARAKLVAAHGITENFVKINGQDSVTTDTYEAMRLLMCDFYETFCAVADSVEDQVPLTEVYAGTEGVIELLDKTMDAENEGESVSETTFHTIRFILKRLNQITEPLDRVSIGMDEEEAAHA